MVPLGQEGIAEEIAAWIFNVKGKSFHPRCDLREPKSAVLAGGERCGIAFNERLKLSRGGGFP